MEAQPGLNFGDLTIAGYNLVQGTLGVLHELVLSDNGEVCLGSARALGTLLHPSSQAPLFRAMGLYHDRVEALAEQAARFRTPATLHRFADLLFGDLHEKARGRIVELIGSFGEPEVMSILAQFARDAKPELRRGVARGLKSHASAEAEALLQKMLEDEDRDVVTQALVSLRTVGREACIPAIEHTLQHYRDPYVRAAALGTLGCLSAGASRDLIRRFLKDTDARIRASAVEALGRHLGSTPDALRDLLPALKDENNRTRANAIVALYPYATEEAMSALQGLIASPKKWHRASAAWCIGELQFPDVMLKLVPLVNTEQEPDVVERALDAIGKITKPGLKSMLFKLAGHPNNQLRARAIAAATRLAGPDDLPQFQERLRTESVPAVKAELLLALGRFAGPTNWQVLLDHFTAKDKVLAKAAIRALSLAQQAGAVPLILPLAKSPQPDVRAEALSALIKLGQLQVVSDVEALLKESDTGFVSAGIAAAQAVFEAIHDLRKREHQLFVTALEQRFSALQAAEVEAIRTGLAAATAAPATEVSRDRSTLAETQLATLLRAAQPLTPGNRSEPLALFAAQNPGDVIASYLDVAHNTAPEDRKLPEELVRAFRHEHFLPGLFLAMDHIKAGGDDQKLVMHVLEMASVEIRILLEFINRAMRYAQEKRDDKAVRMLDFLNHYLRLSPDIHSRFGSFYLVQKEYDLAYHHLLKAYATTPGDFDLLLKLSGAAARLGKLAVAELFAETVRERSDAGSPLRGRADGMLTIISELKRGANPDRPRQAQASPAPVAPAPSPPHPLTSDLPSDDAPPSEPEPAASGGLPDPSVGSPTVQLPLAVPSEDSDEAVDVLPTADV